MAYFHSSHLHRISKILKNIYQRLYFVFGLLFFLNPIQSRAQSFGLDIGDIVKVKAPIISNKKIVGRIKLFTNQSLQISTNNVNMEIPFNSIKTLEKALGKRSHTLEGFLIGGISGAAIGGTFLDVSYAPCTSTDDFSCMFHPTSRTNAFKTGAVIGGFIGVVFGLIIGSQEHTYRWKRIPIKLSLSKLPIDINNKNYMGVLTLKWKFHNY